MYGVSGDEARCKLGGKKKENAGPVPPNMDSNELCKQKCCHPTRYSLSMDHSSSRSVHGPLLYATSNSFFNAFKVVMGYVANSNRGGFRKLPASLAGVAVTRPPSCVAISILVVKGGPLYMVSAKCPHIRCVSLALEVGRILREVCRWE